jgi:hypothetical protein
MCGVQGVGEFIASLQKKRCFWGRRFPDARDDERKRLRENPDLKYPSRGAAQAGSEADGAHDPLRGRLGCKLAASQRL